MGVQCTKLVSESPIARETPNAYILQNGQTVQKPGKKAKGGYIPTRYKVYKNRLWTRGNACETDRLASIICIVWTLVMLSASSALPMINIMLLPIPIIACSSCVLSSISMSTETRVDDDVTESAIAPFFWFFQSIARVVVDEPH